MVQRRLEIDMPLNGQQVVHVRPHDVIDLKGIRIDELKVDIIGSDVVFTSVYSDAKIVMPGLGVYMFSPDDAPMLRVDGQVFQADTMLGKLGDITNVMSSDFVTFSEINEDQTTRGEEDSAKSVSTKDEVISAEEDVGATKEEMMYELAAIVQPVGQKESGNPKQELIEEQEQIKKEEEREALMNSGTDAGLEARPPNSSSPTPPPTPIPEPVEIPQGNTGNTVFGFTASLVQLGSTEEIQNILGVDTRVIQGGGGSEAATNNTSNAVQISPEIIDTTGESDAHVIYADNGAYFSAAEMTRVIRITPALPSGFDMTNIKVTGLPVSFDIEGATSDAGGNYSIDNPVIDADGNIDFIVSYPVPSTQTFIVDFEVTAEFDPASGVSAPTDLILTETLSQEVNVKDVSVPNDLNYVNGDGDIVWVMANNPNQNTVFTGDGDATVFGGVARDVVASAAGDDVISTGAGDDFVASGAGEDTIIDGAGNDTYQGGDGIADKLDYSSAINPVVVNMSVVDGDGYSALVNGGDTDLVKDFENILTGGSADTVTGSNADNIIETGGGDDTLSAQLGNDILNGGNGTDTADFSYSGVALTVDLGTNIGGGFYAATTAVQNVQLKDIEYIIATSHDDTLVGGGGDDHFEGLSGANSFGWSAGNDIFDSTAGTGALYYVDANGVNVSTDLAQGISFDMTVFDGGTQRFDIAIAGLGKTDSVSLNVDTIYAGSGADNMLGDGDAQIFYGGDGADVLGGRAGNDTLFGGDGLDQIFGGADDDTIYADDDGLVDLYDGEAGVDTLILDGVGGDVTLDLASELMSSVLFGNDVVRGIENVTGTGLDDILRGDANDNTFIGNAGNDVLDGRAGDDELIGGAGADTLDGGLGDDVLDGGNNDDFLYGGAGDDTLKGGLGANVLDGQAGTDTLDYTGALAAISVDLANDQVLKSSDSQLDDYADIENIMGSNFDDTFVLDAGDLVAIDTQFDSLNGGAEGAGGDTVEITGSITFDGLEMASVFDNIENVDFSGATLDGGNTEFTITGDDVFGMVGSSSFLHIDAAGTLNFDIISGGLHTLDNPGGTVIDPNTTHYTFDSGAFTLEIQTA
jgi:Ca2+-binding RTX toxin-like protein